MSQRFQIKAYSGKGMSPVWHQAIMQTNADLQSTGTFETNFSENQITIKY